MEGTCKRKVASVFACFPPVHHSFSPAVPHVLDFPHLLFRPSSLPILHLLCVIVFKEPGNKGKVQKLCLPSGCPRDSATEAASRRGEWFSAPTRGLDPGRKLCRAAPGCRVHLTIRHAGQGDLILSPVVHSGSPSPLPFLPMCGPAVPALSSLVKDVSISLNLRSPCGFDEVSAAEQEFFRTVSSQGIREEGQCLASKEACFCLCCVIPARRA